MVHLENGLQGIVRGSFSEGSGDKQRQAARSRSVAKARGSEAPMSAVPQSEFVSRSTTEVKRPIPVNLWDGRFRVRPPLCPANGSSGSHRPLIALSMAVED